MLGYVYMVLYTFAASEIAYSLRLKYTSVILRQDVSKLDDINAASARIGGQGIQEIQRIEVGLGEQLGTTMQLMSVVLSGFIIAVVAQWKLALVVSTMIPATLFTIALTVIVDLRWEKKIQHLYTQTTDAAKAALTNIRDIFASTAESHILVHYDRLLEQAMRYGLKKAPAVGLQYSFEMFFVTIGYTLSFWYGTKLHSEDDVPIGSIVTRAIINNPPILILDEATAGLDVHAEVAVEAALDRASLGKTVINITHKPRQAKKADHMIVLTSHGVSHQGSPDEIRRNKPVFFLLDEDSKGLFENSSAHGNSIEPAPEPKSVPIGSQHFEPGDSIALLGVVVKYSLLRSIAIIMYDQKNHWRWMLALLIPCILGGLTFGAEAIIFGKIVRVFLLPVAQVHSAARFWAYMFLVVAIATFLIFVAIGHNGTILNYKLSREHRLQYLQNIMLQKIEFFDLPRNSPGVLAEKLLQHPNEIEDLLGRNIPVIAIMLVTVISCSILSLVTGWKFGLVAVFGCLGPICLAGLVRIQLEYVIEHRTHELYYESAGFVSEFLHSMRTVTSLCLQHTLLSEYRELLSRPLRETRTKALISLSFLALADSLQLCGLALLLWYGGTLVASRQYTLEAFFTIASSMFFAVQAITKFFGFAYNASNEAKKELAVSFQEVHFRYPTRELPILNGLNVDVSSPLRKRSGAGKKSLLLGLLAVEKFYEPSSGNIYFHGQRSVELAIGDMRRRTALVPQGPWLYRGSYTRNCSSIRENLCLGLDRNVTDTEIVGACQAAVTHDFVSSLPQGLETQCGESGGMKFSGGQRQRLLIARALLRRASLLLLDECTSALDGPTEKLVAHALQHIPHEVTVIAVAHRLSTIRNFDVIFVLDHGCVVEQGSYDELMRLRARFYNMHISRTDTEDIRQVQSKWEETPETPSLVENDDENAQEKNNTG
ncbi:P-loop containing nucleoside triphosphate hydrolase protein [Aspergillus steynii IBT 23096]|uniref:P-loop containing nucleoside triphosphate hydrolase protein n=1 Tax=Aspergillus steynii IBT 23096 TaxID=1392250 RepID=A0A2I2GBC5_9EURO|nr:P-loop containing nucleoside triphosphate hydrolase protein [Aspergillus steynii IBT 23096]PLB50180.1 P-loop containing nucleoside triphosphate hydrolase protein [Aspergillus steynii IBT 23096]